ncbi:glycosyltransferase [Fontisphaera persica]|uniref:glycosyltransferase family 2 protein n=1 Tax=Fontisphaera persica TaxID=2974023 RepID=UPI0024BF7CA2|nr:glycosyltransferase [Fontisphaera persica]WCJ60878.1 glycosyltransferase [Fontisphaera persica]
MQPSEEHAGQCRQPSPAAAEAWGVSVIIPAYNYAQYLRCALDSALAQTHRPVEILVVDDGSTDNTRELVAGYGSKVRYLYQDNAGLSAARNTGLRESRHPFIALLDADDQWHPERLASAIAVFRQLGSAWGVVACRSVRMNSNGVPLPFNPGEQELEGEITAADILWRTRFSPSAVVARKAVFESCGGFDTTLRSSEDRDMWLRAAVRWRIWLQPERLAFIRKHDANMSSNASRMRDNMRRVISKAWQARAVPRHRLDYWLQALAIWRYQTALICAGIGQPAAALRDLLLSLAWWPLPLPGRRIGSAVPWVRLRSLGRLLRPAGITPQTPAAP